MPFVRKWMVISLTVLITTGIFIFIPRDVSVEELKAEYLAACHGTESHPRRKELLRHIITGRGFWTRRYDKRVEKAERALIRCGYLEKQIFVVSNQSPREILIQAKSAFSGVAGTMLVGTNGCVMFKHDFREHPDEYDVFARIGIEGTNIFFVIAPGEQMEAFERFVKAADVPK
jgi:hypothetical protein